MSDTARLTRAVTRPESRRGFIRLMGLAIGGTVLGACTPAAAPAPTSAPAKSQAPATTSGASTSKPTTVAEIAQYTGADRLQILEEGARSEGSVVTYTVLFEDRVIAPLFDKFKTKYPFLESSVFRADTVDVVKRIQEEYQANRYVVDTIELSMSGIVQLGNEGLLQQYKVPNADSLPANAKDPDNYWLGTRQSILAFGYNTDLVKPEEAPKTYEDLLDPKWKGKVAMPRGTIAYNWMEGIFEIMGDEKGLEYLQKLKENEPQLRVESARAVADLLSGGQLALSPGVLNHHIEINQEQGAPVDWNGPDPMISWIGGLSLAKNAPHPHAALLWMDWLVSPEGQQAFADIEYIPVNPKATPKWPRVTQGNIHIVDDEKQVARDEELRRLEREIFVGGT